MSSPSSRYLAGVPSKPYDLLREGLIVLAVIAALVIVLALAFGSPDYPTVRAEDVANNQPLAFVTTSASILAGDSSIQDYGPPYTSDNAHAQRIAGLAPANLFGVTEKIDPVRDFIIKPLTQAAVLDRELDGALQTYQQATAGQQREWTSAYLAALTGAQADNGAVQMPPGNYGPVPAMMQGMLNMARAGLLEGALESDARLPFTLDYTRSLLFFQDNVDHGVAQQLNMLGDQWGISHEPGRYPGAWWLWPYTFLYQVPPMSSSPNADLQAAAISMGLFLLVLLVPFLPIVNRIPRWLRVYRVIWRDWYGRELHTPARTDADRGRGKQIGPGVTRAG